MKNLIYFVFLLLSTQLIGQSVSGHCGMSTADGYEIMPRLQENLQAIHEGLVTERGIINYIPIHFHRVGNAAGTGKVPLKRILDQLCILNAAYAPHMIQFYFSPHPLLGLFDNSINNDNVYDNQTNTLLMTSKKHNNAVNVYVTDIAASSNNQPGLTLAYYSGQRDWVVSRRDQIGYDNATLEHEIGHFLSLAHTFFGWEQGGFDNSFPTWPIAPAVSPGGSPTERVDGSNGTTAADQIVDTNADYNFGFANNGCNPYNGGAKDPTGVLCDPQENNTMGYFSGCDYEFTAGQEAAMKADIQHPSRNYLDNNAIPPSTAISTPTDMLLYPSTDAIAANYDNITFTWNAVPQATYYLFEVDIIQSFTSTKLQSIIVATETDITITTLDANKNYFWRVRPFNVFDACATFTFPVKFNTGTVSGTNEINSIEDWQIAPNPVSGSFDKVDVHINANSTADVQLQLTDVAGKLIHLQTGLSLAIGDNTLSMPINHVAAGLYFLSIKSGTEIATKRLVIE